jgi:hypothetical protein
MGWRSAADNQHLNPLKVGNVGLTPPRNAVLIKPVTSWRFAAGIGSRNSAAKFNSRLRNAAHGMTRNP